MAAASLFSSPIVTQEDNEIEHPLDAQRRTKNHRYSFDFLNNSSDEEENFMIFASLDEVLVHYSNMIREGYVKALATMEKDMRKQGFAIETHTIRYNSDDPALLEVSARCIETDEGITARLEKEREKKRRDEEAKAILGKVNANKAGKNKTFRVLTRAELNKLTWAQKFSYQTKLEEFRQYQRLAKKFELE